MVCWCKDHSLGKSGTLAVALVGVSSIALVGGASALVVEYKAPLDGADMVGPEMVVTTEHADMALCASAQTKVSIVKQSRVLVLIQALFVRG